MGDIRFNCSNCEQKLVVDENLAGTEVQCPYCEHPLHIPDSQAETTPDHHKLQLKHSASGHPSNLNAQEDSTDSASLNCPKCGAQCEADAVICIGCGYNFSTGESLGAEAQNTAVEVWHPHGAANWAVLLSPVLGAFLVARNWALLGETDAHRRAMRWFYGPLAFFLLLSPFVASAINLVANFSLLVAWYVLSCNAQLKYLKTRFGNDFQRKPWWMWWKPVLTGIACATVYILIYLPVLSILFRGGEVGTPPQPLAADAAPEMPAQSEPTITIDTNSVSFIESRAEQASPDVQFDLANRFADGLGVPQNYALAAKWFQKAAEQHHAGAQYNLGILYFEGIGVTQDLSRAFAWYSDAANQGFAPAQFSLGQMYAKGIGVQTNYVRAAELFRASSSQGVALARYSLGILLYHGLGTQSNDVEAAQFFQMAATDGVSIAQTALGKMYYLGRGVSQNKEKALGLFRQALVSGDDEALVTYWYLLESSIRAPFDEKYPLPVAGQSCSFRSINGLVLSGVFVTNQGGLVTIQTAAGPRQIGQTALDLESRIRADASFRETYYGAVIEQQLYSLLFSVTEQSSRSPNPVKGTPDTNSENGTNNAGFAQEDLRLLEQEAEGGNPDAQLTLALLHLQGEYVSNDVAKAVALLEKSAGAGSHDAQEILVTMCFRDGDTNCVSKWLPQLAKTTDGDLAYRIATLLSTDKGNPQRARSVFEWTQRAATNGSLDAVVALGDMYMSGTGTEADPAKSYLNFFRAANRGSPRGMYQLGVASCQGAVVPPNESHGFKWLRKASTEGYVAADRYMSAYKEGKDARLRAERENMEAYERELVRHGKEVERIRKNPRYVVVGEAGRHASGASVGDVEEQRADGSWRTVKRASRADDKKRAWDGRPLTETRVYPVGSQEWVDFMSHTRGGTVSVTYGAGIWGPLVNPTGINY